MKRSGFTQVEMLVAIAIILTLASLLLPIVGRTREVARGVQCKDQLHNLVIASQNYAYQFGTLPAGVLSSSSPIRNEPGGDGLSWCVRLLPFLEQAPLFQLIDLSRPVELQRPEAILVHLSILRCASDTTANGDRPAPSNYAGCHHPVEAPIDRDNRGMLILGRGLDFSEIADGAGLTLLFGEKDAPLGDRGWMSGSPATLRNTGTALQRYDGDAAVMPATSSDPLAVGGFKSPHPYGVNVGMCDSSVRLLAYELDPAILQKLGDRADGELVSPDALTEPRPIAPTPPTRTSTR